MPEIGLFEAIYSARAIRRLKPDPVPEELVTAVLDAAIRAPSGGNAQNWAFIVVRDVELRKQIGAIYRKASDIAEAIYAARGRPAHMRDKPIRPPHVLRQILVGPYRRGADFANSLRSPPCLAAS